MTNLYPIKFEPILHEKVWGGNNLQSKYNKKGNPDIRIGESWEVSGVQGDLSVVSNGYLEGNTIEEIIEVYMGDLVGEQVYEKFGNEFPLLIKLIDANDNLSIQVHPDNKIAIERHNAYGKSEMWYILESDEETKIYSGFKEESNREEYLEAAGNMSLDKLMNIYHPVKGDAFFIPAGTIHSIGRGAVLAEIQQTSDITYRIYDWGRSGLDGNPRELHTDLAADAIDYSSSSGKYIKADPEGIRTSNLLKCKYFTSNIIRIDSPLPRDLSYLDSFVIYICVEGSCRFVSGRDDVLVERGETILIPATLDSIKITSRNAILIETYIENEQLNNSEI